jgi:heme o synthase
VFAKSFDFANTRIYSQTLLIALGQEHKRPIGRESIAVAVRTVERKTLSALGQKWEDFKQLVKLRLSLTVVFSSVMAYLIAVPGTSSVLAIVILALGGFMVTAAANILNEVLEKDYDRLMKRTADRPLAAGRMKVSDAVLLAGVLTLLGITALAFFNPWTAFFGMLALVSYAFLYTPLKRVSPIAVVVGAFPGALPTLIGAAAAEGYISALGFMLFGIQFFWQFPHFWSIAWLGREDYEKAGYKMLPGPEGKKEKQTGLQAFVYALFLLPMSVLLKTQGFAGTTAFLVILVLSTCFAYLGWRLYQNNDRKSALHLMFFSFIYIPFVLGTLLIDQL